MRRSTWIAMMLATSAVVVGCPGDDGGGDGTAGSASSDESATSADGTASASSASATSTTSTGTASATSSTGEDTATSAADTGSTSDTTGGQRACEVSLPEPGMCQMGGQVGPRFSGLEGVIGGGSDLAARSPSSADIVGEPSGPVGGGFIMTPDAGGSTIECDIFAQDCPDGQKCMPWDSGGGSSWNATKCSPIADNPNGVGDPCTVEGSGVSGVDDCDGTSMCWDVDPQTNMGTCVAFCTCSADNPICEPDGTFCSITNNGVLAICLSVCNPLDPTACGSDDVCVASSGMFLCIPDASGESGSAGDPCEYFNVCDPGLFCANADSVPGCTGSGCCSSYCTIGDDGNCLAGQECVPWYGQGEAPDACLAEVGACTVP